MSLTTEQVKDFKDGVRLASIALSKLKTIDASALEHLSPNEYDRYFKEAIVALETARLRFNGQ